MVVVELVGSEALERRLVAASSYGDQVNGEEEDDLMGLPWFWAQLIVASTGFETWNECRHGQQNQTLCQKTHHHVSLINYNLLNTLEKKKKILKENYVLIFLKKKSFDF